jgi:hypothetical protein
MAESKYGKYIISELKHPKVEAAWSPPAVAVGKNKTGRVLYMDNDIVPGSFYTECVWFMPSLTQNRPPGSSLVGTDTHTHDYDEIIAFIGTDLNDPYDLGGEIELWLDDEKHTITKSSLIFVPAGLKHCPLKIIKVNRPIFHFTTGPGKVYF